MTFTPRPYQEMAIEHALSVPRGALFADMGLGKTVSALTALDELHGGRDSRKTLVLAPLRVAASTWPQEIEKWPHLGRLSYRVIKGTACQRTQLLRGKEDIHLINYELLPWLVETLGDRWPYDTLVLDESSKVKNHNTKRFRALRKLRAAHDRVIALTGTPAPNGLHDLWAQVYLLDGGERLGRTVTAFRERWFSQGYFNNYEPLPNAQDEIQARIADLCLSICATDWFPTEAPRVVPVEVELPAPAMRNYLEMERAFFTELESGAQLDATSAAAKSAKCHQLANGAVYTEGKAWEEVHKAKLDALEDVLEEAAGAPVMVAYYFQSDLARLKRRFPQAKLLDKDGKVEREWNAGRVPLLLAHPDSVGHGLNLQYGGHRLAFFSLTWNLESYQQIVERLGPVRQKQAGFNRLVYVYHIIAKGTIDELILERLEGKASVQDILKAAMARRLAA